MEILGPLSTWGKLLDRAHSWEPWLSKRMEGLEALSGGSVVVLLLDPRSGDFVSVTRSASLGDRSKTQISRLERDEAGPLGKIVHKSECVDWHDGDIPQIRGLPDGFASISATPLRAEDMSLGVIAVGFRAGKTPCSSRLLSEWVRLIGEGFALRLAQLRQEGEHRWRSSAFKDISTSTGDPGEVLRSLLGRGFADHGFHVVGCILFDNGEGRRSTMAHVLELQNQSFDRWRPMPIVMPTIGSLLRRTLEADQTVRVGPTTRGLYLSDASELANFMDARGLTEGVFSPVLTELGVSGAVFALAEQVGLTDGAVSRVDELARMIGVVLHYRFDSTEALKKLDHVEEELEKSRSLGDQTSDLIQHVLADKPLHDLTRRLARQIGTPLLVEGPSLEWLSFAWPAGTPNIYLDDRERLLLSALVRDPEGRRRLQDADDSAPTYLELPDAFPHADVRVVAPVRINGEVVGYLSSLRGGRERDAEADHLLGLAASFVGLHMIRQQTTEEVRHRLSGELVNDLLGGRRDESITSRVHRLGYDLTPPYFLVVLLWRRRRGVQTASKVTAKMVMGLTADVVSRWYPRTLIGEKDGFVLFTLGVEDEAEAAEVADRVVSATQNAFSSVSVSACVSRRCSRLWDMESAYADAAKVLRLFEDVGGAGRIISASHLGSFTALLQTDNLGELREFASNWLSPLLNYDAEKNSALVTTLHAYLRNWGHQGKTAEDLRVHVSTLKYRLQRIRDLGGFDLSDPETRTQAQLACQILRAIEVLHGDETGYPSRQA